jgi:hypothetical protein
MSDLKIIPLQQDDKSQAQIVALLEEALARAKAGDVRHLIIAYGLRGEEVPVMQWRGTSTRRDIADAVFACEALKQAIITKNMRVT